MRCTLPCCLGVLASLMVAGVACAQTYAAPVAEGSFLPVIAVDREVWASFDAQDSFYKEHFPADALGHDRERGWTPGFGVGARWMSDLAGIYHVYVGVDYHHQIGNLDYIGSVFDSNAPLNGSSGLVTDDVIGEFGKGFVVAPNVIVTPVVQVGYHSWHRNITADQTEDYSHLLVGAAVRANIGLMPRLVATLRLGVAGMIDPKIDIRFDGNYPQSLGGSAILQAGGRLDYAVTRQIHVFAGADLQHFGYGASKGSAFGNDGIIF